MLYFPFLMASLPLPYLVTSLMLNVSFCLFAAELNGYSETISKRSIPIQPQVVAVPDHAAHGDADRYSEYSHHSQKARSNRGFQL
jgi:hypothetical protein